MTLIDMLLPVKTGVLTMSDLVFYKAILEAFWLFLDIQNDFFGE